MPNPMGREKGQGTGPFEITLPSGTKRWRVAVTMADGRRVWRTGRTPREAERKRKELVEARELDLDPTRQTLADYLRSWIKGLRDARNQRIRPRTLDHYTLVVERHIIPALGKHKLAAVTGRRVQAWLDADSGSPRTVLHHHAVLRRALNVAVRQRLLAYNPAAAVELPRPRADTASPLSLDEAHRLLTATRGDRLHALWRLAIVTGLRQGELLGLGWDDVDGATVTVRSQLQRLISPGEREAAQREGRKPRGSWVRTPPKAARKLASVAVDAATVAVLDEHKRLMTAERAPAWEYFGLIFPTPEGQPYHQSELLRAFHAACDSAGIPRRRFHDLRGTSATLMRAAGVPEDDRMARLGHSTTDMARHYAAASEVQDRAAADRLGEALSG
jgi:integrase